MLVKSVNKKQIAVFFLIQDMNMSLVKNQIISKHTQLLRDDRGFAKYCQMVDFKNIKT